MQHEIDLCLYSWRTINFHYQRNRHSWVTTYTHNRILCARWKIRRAYAGKRRRFKSSMKAEKLLLFLVYTTKQFINNSSSKYSQSIYEDLFHSFYDFVCPITCPLYIYAQYTFLLISYWSSFSSVMFLWSWSGYVLMPPIILLPDVVIRKVPFQLWTVWGCWSC